MEPVILHALCFLVVYLRKASQYSFHVTIMQPRKVFSTYIWFTEVWGQDLRITQLFLYCLLKYIITQTKRIC